MRQAARATKFSTLAPRIIYFSCITLNIYELFSMRKKTKLWFTELVWWHRIVGEIKTLRIVIGMVALFTSGLCHEWLIGQVKTCIASAKEDELLFYSMALAKVLQEKWVEAARPCHTCHAHDRAQAQLHRDIRQDIEGYKIESCHRPIVELL